jgi:hypothetical protein
VKATGPIAHKPAMRSALALALLATACGADHDVPATVPVSDSSGIPLDTASDALEDTELDELTVQPSIHTVMIDSTAAETSARITYTVQYDATDLTSVSSFAIDPAAASFAGNVLSTKVPLPMFEIGKTFVVTARANMKRGRAKLTIVRLKTTGETRDFLFESAHGSAPSPEKDLFKVSTTSTNGGLDADVSVVLRNDPLNPPSVDARKLVTIRAMGEGYPKLAPPACEAQTTRDADGDGTADTFLASSTPRALCFEVRAVTNVLVTSGENASFHRVFVDVVTSTGKTLQSRSVVVMVPATDPVPR